jgi:hypothetical protein
VRGFPASPARYTNCQEAGAPGGFSALCAIREMGLERTAVSQRCARSKKWAWSAQRFLSVVRDPRNSSGRFLFQDLGIQVSHADAPDETHGAEHFQRDPGDVQFPPGESMAGRSLVRVMIVVPALAEG